MRFEQVEDVDGHIHEYTPAQRIIPGADEPAIAGFSCSQHRLHSSRLA
jgi:hypothetical protein